MENSIKKKVAASLLALSLSGVAFIYQAESSSKPITTAYYDQPGISTICVGHTKGVVPGMKVSPKQCEVWLKEDATEAGKAVGRLVKVPVTQGQFDAMTSLVFNIGSGAFAKSSVLRYTNAGQCHKAADSFLLWNKITVRGKLAESKGISLRRASESSTYRQGC